MAALESTPNPGRPRGAIWRQLQTEGIVWEGHVTLAADSGNMAVRLVVTHQRFVFTRGTSIVLEVPREWLRPAPYLGADGTVNLQIDPTGDGEPEKFRLICRYGRPMAAHLVSLVGSAGVRISRSLPSYVSEIRPATGPLATPPTADVMDPRAAKLAALAVLDPDKFPPMTARPATGKSAERPMNVPYVADAAPSVRPVAIRPAPTSGPILIPASTPPASNGRYSDWNLQPIGSPRDQRKSWVSLALRSTGLVILLAIGVAFGAGHLPSFGDDTGSNQSAELNAPFSGDDPTATKASVAIVQPTATTPATTIDATEAALSTAAAIGIGGPTGTVEPANTPVPPTRTSVPTVPNPTSQPTRLPTNVPPTATNAPPTATSVPATKPVPTTKPVVAADVTKAPTLAPTQEPTAVPTVQPTVAPTIASTEEPTTQPTLVPSTIPTEPTIAPVVTETPKPVATATPEPTQTAEPTATRRPTKTPTAAPAFPAQDPSLAKGELPAQSFATGNVQYTIDASLRDAGFDALGLPTYDGLEWTVVIVNAQNLGTADVFLGASDFYLFESGPTATEMVNANAAGAVVADTLGLPAAVPGSQVTIASGGSYRFALAYQIYPDASTLQLIVGYQAVMLTRSLAQPVDLAALGEATAPALLEATVVEVIDGRTIVVNINGEQATVQYIGIDTPSINACYGYDAIAANEALVTGQTVWLEREWRNGGKGGILLRDVWVTGPNGDLVLVARELARNGAAIADPASPDIRYNGWIDAAAGSAAWEGLGLWGYCGSYDPTE